MVKVAAPIWSVLVILFCLGSFSTPAAASSAAADRIAARAPYIFIVAIYKVDRDPKDPAGSFSVKYAVLHDVTPGGSGSSTKCVNTGPKFMVPYLRKTGRRIAATEQCGPLHASEVEIGQVWLLFLDQYQRVAYIAPYRMFMSVGCRSIRLDGPKMVVQDRIIRAHKSISPRLSANDRLRLVTVYERVWRWIHSQHGKEVRQPLCPGRQ